MKKTKKENKNHLIPILIFLVFIVNSCNSDKNSLIGGTWKLQKCKTEFKINDKFEKMDSISNMGLLFNEISFINNNEFNFSSKGITSENDNDVSLLGGAGFYKRIDNKIILEYSMQKQSLNIKIDSIQLVLSEELNYDPNEPMIMESENNSPIKITAIRNTYIYKK
jgi:hypothetical protein